MSGRPAGRSLPRKSRRGSEEPADERFEMKMKARPRSEEGAAAGEFALIVGVLAMLIFGMLQFGLAFFELQNLRSATREASRVGAVRGTVGDMQNKMTELTGVQ